jgi:large subunit ribosomal protein L31
MPRRAPSFLFLRGERRQSVVGAALQEGVSAETCSYTREEKHLKGDHPELVTTHVRCSSCGSEFTTRSVRTHLVVDVCNHCHPAFTGVEQQVVRGSRIERFKRRRLRAATA